MLKQVFEISPARVIHQFINKFLNILGSTFLYVYFMRYLFQSGDINRSMGEVTTFIIIVAIIMFFLSIYNAWYNNVFLRENDIKVSFTFNKILFEKAASVDISCYENPEFYENYTKAISVGSKKAIEIVSCLSSIIANFVSFTYVIYTLFTLNIIAGIYCTTIVIFCYFLGRFSSKVTYQRDIENVKFDRRIDYVDRVMYLQQYAKEIRLTNIFNVLKTMYEHALKNKNNIIDKYWKSIYRFNVFSEIFSSNLIFNLSLLFAAFSAMVTKSINLSGFILISTGVINATWTLFDFVRGINQTYQNAKYISNFRTFIDYKPKIDESQDGLPVGEIKVLTFDNVSFKYDGHNEYVLKNICMTISAGEKVALVGHNGAGKTTLVKLIMRLYDPTEGKILLNGIDIKEYNIKEYRKAIGTVFQDFKIFSMSVIDNILMQDAKDQKEYEKAIEAMKLSEIYNKVETFKYKENTILTKEFDDEGEVLSGGEYQKIAIARAIAKGSRILILDEPCSALDPLTENKIHELILRLCSLEQNKDKISIIISHRLSLAASSNYIYVMENGQIVESGRHSELIEKNGVYADMFKKQLESYSRWC